MCSIQDAEFISKAHIKHTAGLVKISVNSLRENVFRNDLKYDEQLNSKYSSMNLHKNLCKLNET